MDKELTNIIDFNINPFKCSPNDKYEVLKLVNEYINKKIIKTRIDENRKWLNYLESAEQHQRLPLLEQQFIRVIKLLEKEIKNSGI